MIPGEMMVLSNYVTVSRLGWVNDDGIGSYLAMIVPFTVSIFHIYLLRQNFKQIPDELYYAAKIDGSTDFKYLWQIMVPMAKSSIITITILKLMGSWNAYIWPNLVANSKYKLVTSWLRSSFVDEAEGGRVLMNYQMAATVIVTVPLLIFFVVFRKYIMSGVSRSGVKG
jgi:multiple sugar transport system permease protein